MDQRGDGAESAGGIVAAGSASRSPSADSAARLGGDDEPGGIEAMHGVPALVHASRVGGEDATRVRRWMSPGSAPQARSAAACALGSRAPSRGAIEAAGAPRSGSSRRVSRTTLGAQVTGIIGRSSSDRGQGARPVTRHPRSRIAQDFGSIRPVVVDRKRPSEPAVTHQPLAWDRSNLARFRCADGRNVTHQPGQRGPRRVQSRS